MLKRFDAWVKTAESTVTLNGPAIKPKENAEKESAFEQMVRNVKRHIRKGCLSDLPKLSYYQEVKKTATGRTILSVSRGSSGNEATHSAIRDVVGINSNQETAAIGMVLCCFRLSIQAGRDRGLFTPGSHWFVWRTRRLNQLQQQLYGLERYTLPVIGGLQIPSDYDSIGPLGPALGLSSGHDLNCSAFGLTHVASR